MPKQKPNEQVQQIPLSEIRPFKNHPFKVTDDELMQQTIDSIMQVGVLNPAIIRPAPEGGYEMVAGHRRLHAADLAGLKTIPAIVRNLDDDEAVILMVDSNLQRETISPMERAQAYKMKLEALKHQGKRTDLTSTQVGRKLESAEVIAQQTGESKNQVRRFIRLTELVPEIQKKVDSKEIAFSPAVELSYLTRDEQKQFLDAMDYIENLISSIVTVPIDDGVKFQLKSISEIMDEAEYPGIRVSMSTTFDGVVTPLKIDISTGDAITPREVRYSFKLMLEDRSIDIWAYNLETVLAEKLETIITRTTTNTRMRDFYDIYILEQLHGTTLNPKILHDALLATAHKRGSEKYLNQAEEVFDEVENDSVMQKLWEAYRKKFSYASDLEWDVIMKAIRRLYVLCEKGICL